MLERARTAVRVAATASTWTFHRTRRPRDAADAERAAAAAPVRHLREAVRLGSSVRHPPRPWRPRHRLRDAYRSTVQPAIDRFDELKPFLLSAAASPSEPVLKAVGSTLVGIQGLLLSVEVPAESRTAHDVLSSAVAAAVTAVNPTFGGDRAAQAKQALGCWNSAS
jgi:hypothetical protein